jgi:hypothetical protein
VQNVFSRKATADEKETHPQNLFAEMLVQNVFSWAAAANKTTQQISSKKCA